MGYYYFYVGSDSNEVKSRVEGRDIPTKELIKHYTFSIDNFKINGSRLKIINITKEYGMDIQKRYNLSFNPMSVILGEFNTKQKNDLVGRLVNENFTVLEFDGDKVIEHHQWQRRKKRRFFKW